MEERRKRRLQGEGNKIKLIDLRFERWQVVGFRNGRRRQDAISTSLDDKWRNRLKGILRNS